MGDSGIDGDENAGGSGFDVFDNHVHNHGLHKISDEYCKLKKIRVYSTKRNDAGYSFGDKVIVMSDRAWYGGPKTEFQGKVARVVGHTPKFVWVMIEPVSAPVQKLAVIQKRSHNVKRI